MTEIIRKCSDEERRNILKSQECTLNGIDYLEVYPLGTIVRSYGSAAADDHGNGDKEEQEEEEENYNTILVVYCFREITDTEKLKVLIKGGIRIKDIKIKWIKRADELIDKPSSSTRDPNTIKVQDYTYGNELLSIIRSTQRHDKTDGKLDNVLIVCTDREGDFSEYTLCIVSKEDETKLPPKFDVVFSQVKFFFKFLDSKNFDKTDARQYDSSCSSDLCGAIDYFNEPIIDYMAKDFASFSRLMLDRLSIIMPEWGERSAADIGIMLVELFAYVGDHLSYFQDAVGTEAYLPTARSRISLKRHARLLDYPIQEGSNSRVWVCFEFDSTFHNDQEAIIPDGTILLANGANYNNNNDNNGASTRTKQIIIYDEDELAQRIKDGDECFQTVGDTKNFCYERNEIHFYTWSNSHCCLPAGSTHATLMGDNETLKLQKGDILIFEEVEVHQLSSSSSTLTSEPAASYHGSSNDTNDSDDAYDGNNNNSNRTALRANPLRRHAVRIEEVSKEKKHDMLFDVDVIEVSWNIEDALPFPMYICEDLQANKNQPYLLTTATATKLTNSGKCHLNTVVRANVVLAEHGRTVYEFLGATPGTPHQANFNPSLSLKPLTYRPHAIANYSYNLPNLSANATINFPGTTVTTPSIRLYEVKAISDKKIDDIKKENTIMSFKEFQSAIANSKSKLSAELWNVKQDLLQCNEFDQSFVVEVDSDGTASIRFGDDKYGKSAPISTYGITHLFYAKYKIGNGISGNVGADTITQMANIASNNDIATNIINKGSLSTIDPRFITNIRNPLAARGGREPETSKSIRKFASRSLQLSFRATKEEDYIRLLKSHPKIKKAMARIIWTGSWYTVYITIERNDGRRIIDDKFKSEIEEFLNRYRLAGYDLDISGPIYVPLYILIKVHVASNFFRNEVKHQLLQKYGNSDPSRDWYRFYRQREEQQLRQQQQYQQELGISTVSSTTATSNNIMMSTSSTQSTDEICFFDSNNLNFGQSVQKSKIRKIALSVPGVQSVDILQFRRLDEIENNSNNNDNNEIIELAANQIPRVDNNPDNPEYGRIELILEGGL